MTEYIRERGLSTGMANTGKMAIVGGRIVTPYNVLSNHIVIIHQGRISAIGKEGSIVIPDDAEVVDAQGGVVGPGFIDIHVHGGGGHWSYLNPAGLARSHLQFGTTAILPTISYNESRSETLEGVRRIVAAMNDPSGSIAGIHLEGPFINPKYGAILSPIRPIDREEYAELLETAGKYIKLWTFAPELAGADAFVDALAEYGIVMSAGHSEATPESIFACVPKGLKIGCHTTNACGTTPSPSRYAGTREVGVAEAILVHDDMYAEVIPDADGVHVRPLMLKLIVKAKGTDKVIIITDGIDTAAVEQDACPDIRYDVKNQLSGSKLTMNAAMRNMMNHTGIGWVDAFKMAAFNPAKALGLDRDMGSLEIGKLANLVVVDDRLHVLNVMLRGEWVSGRRQEQSAG